MSEELTSEEIEQIRKSREDLQAGRYRTFSSVEEYIKSLEEEE